MISRSDSTRLADIASNVVADANRMLPDAFDDPGLRSGFDAAFRRHDLTRPPLQIARLVYGAIRGCEAPLRLSTLVALVHVGAGLHDDVSDGDVSGGRVAQGEALLLSGVCLSTLAPYALTQLVEPARALRALQILWSGMQTMAGGQRRDLALCDDERPDLRAAEAALAKTTGECGMYAALGAFVAGVTDDGEIARWEAFGADIGYALQLGSDCQDVADPSGRDIASGARTLPIAFALHAVADIDARTVVRGASQRARRRCRRARGPRSRSCDARFGSVRNACRSPGCARRATPHGARASRRLSLTGFRRGAVVATQIERLAARPLPAAEVRLEQRPDDGVWLLERNGRYVQLSPAARAIWLLCDGERTWAQIAARYFEEFGVDGTVAIGAFAKMLEERGFFAE